MSRYPQHDKMRSVQTEARVVEDFIRYVKDGREDVALVRFGETPSDWITLSDRDIQRLVNDYFGIDDDAFRREKQQMFNDLRQQQREARPGQNHPGFTLPITEKTEAT